jgi:hypothetical protein
MKLRLLLTGAALATVSMAASAHGATITGLWNTGVDALGNPLADGSLETHYLLNGAPSPFVYTHPAYIVEPDAKFIAANANGGYTTNPNTFSLTFSLAGLNASTAQLSGFFAADNFASIFLNGHLLAQDNQATDPANFQSLTAFSSGSGNFVAGLNTLSLVVTDTGPPSAGLIRGLTGSADLLRGVPEPAAWTLMLVGFGALGAALRSRKALAAV